MSTINSPNRIPYVYTSIILKNNNLTYGSVPRYVIMCDSYVIMCDKKKAVVKEAFFKAAHANKTSIDRMYLVVAEINMTTR